MPFIKLVKRPHECYTPSVWRHKGNRRVDVGSVWMCPGCGQQYMLENVIEESQKKFPDQVMYWRKMAESEYLQSSQKGGD